MLEHLKSWSMLRYAVVALVAFGIGSATVASAVGPLKLFAIGNELGTNVAQVNEDGELLVLASGSVDVTFPATQDVSVTNFPSVQDRAEGMESRKNKFVLYDVIKLIKWNNPAPKSAHAGKVRIHA